VLAGCAQRNLGCLIVEPAGLPWQSFYLPAQVGCSRAPQLRNTTTPRRGKAQFYCAAQAPSRLPGSSKSPLVGHKTFCVTVRGSDHTRQECRRAPGVATDWTVSADGKKYTFNLRPEARWSNGERVSPRISSPPAAPGRSGDCLVLRARWLMSSRMRVTLLQVRSLRGVGVSAHHRFDADHDLATPVPICEPAFTYERMPVHRPTRFNIRRAGKARRP